MKPVPFINASAFLLLILHATSAFDFVDVSEGNEKELRKIVGCRKEDVSVEVAIICDIDFGTVFRFDRSRVLQYWQALFWDVQLRFKTLKKVNISFRVTSITVIKHPDEQFFVEKARTPEGKVVLEKALPGFQQWLFNETVSLNLPNYDIAIAAVGADVEGPHGAGKRASACQMDFENEKILSSAAVAIRVEDPARTVAFEIAHLLGASYDSEQIYKHFNCGVYNPGHHHLMSPEDEFSRNQSYFFSHCSAKVVSQFLRTLQAYQCLHSEDDTDTATYALGYPRPIINTAVLAEDPEATVGISVDQQCKLMMKSTSAFLMSEEITCFAAICRLGLNSKIIRPLDGTPCYGDEGRCFRGNCETMEAQLMNTYEEQCLGNDNHFSSKGSPKLVNCKTISIPMDHVHLFQRGSEGIAIIMRYSSDHGSKISGKCLTVDGKLYELKFQRCVRSNAALRWDIIKLDHENPWDEGEFLLRHKETQMCIVPDLKSDKILVTSNCSVTGERMRWKLVEDYGRIVSYQGLENFIVQTGKDEDPGKPDADAWIDWKSPGFPNPLVLSLWLAVVILLWFVFSKVLQLVYRRTYVVRI